MKNIVNCCPHDVNIVDEQGRIILSFPQGETVARRRTVDVSVDLEGIGVPITGRPKRFVEVMENLPDPKEGTFYIVSRITAKAAIDRADLLVPQDVVRDKSGKKLGCRSLGFVW